MRGFDAISTIRCFSKCRVMKKEKTKQNQVSDREKKTTKEEDEEKKRSRPEAS